ncbi:hypothetical protein C4552_03245 [Candidatus Parcubacteria bacterium]|nr:MAG: hypothetical protein C4552_03245 [Candidatus Parcubacteria bacterium]
MISQWIEQHRVLVAVLFWGAFILLITVIATVRDIRGDYDYAEYCGHLKGLEREFCIQEMDLDRNARDRYYDSSGTGHPLWP